MQQIKILIAEWWPNYKPVLMIETKDALKEIGVNNGEVWLTDEFNDAYDWLINKGPWSLLISDVNLSKSPLPDQMTGRILLEKAKDMQVPSIAISGWPKLTPKHVRDILLDDGASDFFYKQEKFPAAEFRNLVQRLVLLAIFPLYQRKLIADTLKHFDPRQFDQIFKALQRIEIRDSKEIGQKLTDIQGIFTELLQERLLEKQIPLQTDVETISTVLSTTRLDTVQKLKLSIPIIPWILIYEAQFELPNLDLSNRIKNIWKWLLY